MHNIEIQYKEFNDYEMISGDIVLVDKDRIKIYRNNLIFKEILIDNLNNKISIELNNKE